MPKFFTKILMLCCTFSLLGCAMIDERVALNYQPKLKTAAHPATKHAIVLGDIEDYRGNDDDQTLAFKENPSGTFTTARYLGQEPLKATIRSALYQGLTHQGYQLNENKGNLVLSGEVLRYVFDPNKASLKGDIKTILEINFTLTNSKTMDQIWTKTFRVKTVFIDGPLNFKSDKTVLQLEFQQAMDKVLSKLINEPQFRQALERYG